MSDTLIWIALWVFWIGYAGWVVWIWFDERRKPKEEKTPPPHWSQALVAAVIFGVALTWSRNPDLFHRVLGL